MEFVDPFKQSTSRFKELLDRDSKPKVQDIEDVEPFEVTDDYLSSQTIKGLPPSAFQAVQKAKDKLQANEAQKAQVSKMFNQLFTDLNQKYGLNIQFDFNSFSNQLSYIIEPTNKRAMEYYLSEAYGRFRVVLYQQYLNAIAILSAQILDPAYLLSESMTYADKLETMQKLYEFMSTMNEIYEAVNIPDTEVKLEKLSEDQNTPYNLNDPNVRKFMDGLFRDVTDSTKQLEK